MPVRVAGYDGTVYCSQIINLEKGQKPYPVITLVLYFGYRKHWDQPTTLYEALEVSDELKPFVNDLKINLFEIAYLSRDQVNEFQSDFKVVADYFVQMRENRSYNPGNEVVNHIEAVLQLLNVMDDDHRFEEKINEKVKKGEVKTMSEWLTHVLDESELKGQKEGMIEGRKEGENRLAKLMMILLSQGRTEDAGKAAEDADFRNRLYQEFQIG